MRYIKKTHILIDFKSARFISVRFYNIFSQKGENKYAFQDHAQLV